MEAQNGKVGANMTFKSRESFGAATKLKIIVNDSPLHFLGYDLQLHLSQSPHTTVLVDRQDQDEPKTALRASYLPTTTTLQGPEHVQHEP